MQKQVLLNAAGVAVLALMSACGTMSDKKEEAKPAAQEQPSDIQKAAAAEVPADQQAVEVVAQADTPAPATTEAPVTGETPKPEDKTAPVTTDQKPATEQPAPEHEAEHDSKA